MYIGMYIYIINAKMSINIYLYHREYLKHQCLKIQDAKTHSHQPVNTGHPWRFWNFLATLEPQKWPRRFSFTGVGCWEIPRNEVMIQHRCLHMMSTYARHICMQYRHRWTKYILMRFGDSWQDLGCHPDVTRMWASSATPTSNTITLG